MSIRILPSSTLRYKLIYPTTIIFKFSKARKKHCIRKKNTVFRKKTCEKTKTAFFLVYKKGNEEKE